MYRAPKYKVVLAFLALTAFLPGGSLLPNPGGLSLRRQGKVPILETCNLRPAQSLESAD